MGVGGAVRGIGSAVSINMVRRYAGVGGGMDGGRWGGKRDQIRGTYEWGRVMDRGRWRNG